MNELSFIVLGRGQQRGSKVAMPVFDRRSGGYRRNKSGGLMIVNRDDNPKSMGWMQEVKIAAVEAMLKIKGFAMINEPIELTAKFYFNRPASHFCTGRNRQKLKPSAPSIHAQSPDLAKLLRSLEDALTGVVWVDDKLVYSYGIGTGRYWTEEQERTEVLIRW